MSFRRALPRQPNFAEKFDYAHRTLEFQQVFDRLLKTKGAELWLEWTGKWVTLYLYLEAPDTSEPIYRYAKKHGLQQVNAPRAFEDFRDAMLKIGQLHGARLDLTMRNGKGKFDYDFVDGSNVITANFIEVEKGKAVKKYEGLASEAV